MRNHYAKRRQKSVIQRGWAQRPHQTRTDRGCHYLSQEKCSKATCAQVSNHTTFEVIVTKSFKGLLYWSGSLFTGPNDMIVFLFITMICMIWQIESKFGPPPAAKSKSANIESNGWVVETTAAFFFRHRRTSSWSCQCCLGSVAWLDNGRRGGQVGWRAAC